MKFTFIQIPRVGMADVPKKFDHKPGTVCLIQDGNGQFLAAGEARLHPNDPFDWALGSKKAAARAIQNFAPSHSPLDRQIRTDLWELLWLQAPELRG